MLPWSEALRHDDGAERYRQAYFTALLGEAGREILCEEAPYGQARLACAVERTFLDGLRGIARQHGHSCLRVESILTAAAHGIVPERYQALAIIEPGQLVLATLAQGRIGSVQAQPGQAALPPGWALRAPQLGEVAQVALLSREASALPAGTPSDTAYRRTIQA
jgi:hypothetical protein